MDELAASGRKVIKAGEGFKIKKFGGPTLIHIIVRDGGQSKNKRAIRPHEATRAKVK